MPIFAVLVASGVAFGMLALSVDVGNVMYERRQLQNSADASSLALARACAETEDPAADCVPGNPEVESLLDENASDGLAQYDTRADAPDGACGRNTGNPLLPDCASDKSDAAYDELIECPPLPGWLRDNSIPYVETYTLTESKETNPTVLPRYFSRLIVGGGEDISVQACARAAWGPLSAGLPTLPIVLGQCNWNIATANGTRFVVSPPYLPAPNTSSPSSVPSLENRDGSGLLTPSQFVTQIFGHVNGSEAEVLEQKFPCNPEIDEPSGQYGPGGFGWLATCGELGASEPLCEDAPTECHVPISSDGTAPGAPGGATPMDCKNLIGTFVGQEVDIPIVTGVTGTGDNLVYAVDGISSFFLAGYYNINNAQPSDQNAYLDAIPDYASKTCFNADDSKPYKSTCIWGWFTSPVRGFGTIDPDATPRGPTVIQPAG